MKRNTIKIKDLQVGDIVVTGNRDNNVKHISRIAKVDGDRIWGNQLEEGGKFGVGFMGKPKPMTPANIEAVISTLEVAE